MFRKLLISILIFALVLPTTGCTLVQDWFNPTPSPQPEEEPETVGDTTDEDGKAFLPSQELGESVAVEVKDTEGNPLSDIEVGLITDGEKVLVVAADPSKEYIPGIYFGEATDLREISTSTESIIVGGVVVSGVVILEVSLIATTVTLGTMYAINVANSPATHAFLSAAWNWLAGLFGHVYSGVASSISTYIPAGRESAILGFKDLTTTAARLWYIEFEKNRQALKEQLVKDLSERVAEEGYELATGDEVEIVVIDLPAIPQIPIQFPLIFIINKKAETTQAPTADFGYSPSNPTVGETIHFTDESYDPDGTIEDWNWDFDDGYTSSSQNPSHSYSSAGSYQVCLTVEDNDEASDTTCKYIDVQEKPNEPPVADFRYSPSSPEVGETVRFTDESYDSDGYITDWDWDFDDGYTSSSQNPSHSFSSSGSYKVCLTVEDNDGATDEKCRYVDVQSGGQPTGQTIKLQGHVTSGISIISNVVKIKVNVDRVLSGPSPCTYSNLLVKADLDVIGGNINFGGQDVEVYGNYYSGCYVYVEESHHYIKVISGGGENQPPVADFTYERKPQYWQFWDQSYDPDGYITSWYWTFQINGHFFTSTAQNPKVDPFCGTFEISLRVTDDKGAQDTVNKFFTDPCPPT